MTRVYVAPALGDGSVYVYLATASGAVPGAPDDPNTDLGIVAREIFRKAVPNGVTAYVESAVPKSVTLAVDVWVDAGASLTDAEVRALVEQKLRDYFTSIPIGGHVLAPGAGRIPWRALIGQVEAASPFIIEARLTAEADIPMAIPEVATLAPLAVNVHHVIPAAA